MTKKIIKFDDNETEELYQYKTPISINDIDINKIKYLISFLLVKKILIFHWLQTLLKNQTFMRIPFTNYYISKKIIKYNENRCIYFLIKEGKVFKKYMEILEKVSNIIKTKLIVNLYIIRNI